MSAPEPFDLAGPLPSGVTVLEASAGTGKTYAIAGLAARFVAEGIPLEQMLLVTFTRMATGELRERVRERLSAVERGLRAVRSGAELPDDRVVARLAAGPAAEAATAGHRLARALADFDAATIATTHGFCQEVLGQLGVAGDLEPDVELIEDPSDLIEEVVDDLYLRRFHRESEPELSRAEAMTIARAAVANPGARIVAGADGVAATRSRLAEAVCQELERRKQRAGVMTYDDVLMRLDRALGGPNGAEVAARLRERYGVVLVDEFQDTDPIQWRIMDRAFGQTGATLVLIADPKQAIYAFRGADVYAYLAAARRAGEPRTLTINWRSDQLLLDAYDALLHDAQLGHEGIVYRRVRAGEPGQHRRLHGAPGPAALRLRLVDRETVDTTYNGFARAPAARAIIAADLAADVVALLSSEAEIECAAEGRRGQREPVCPAHLAVLVRTNWQASEVREALGCVDVPAVTAGAGSVFGSPAAQHWLRLLEALEMPQALVRAHTAALTPFIGWTAEAIAAADPDALESLHLRLHDWARVLRDAGVASLLEAVSRAERLPARVLRRIDGERTMTDLRHVGQLLHAAALEEGLGSAALAAWLRRRMLESDRENADEERSRRLESDADAVQVLTIHRSKGLEFPIVLLPFLWDFRGPPRDPKPVCFHDPGASHERRLDVTLTGSGYRAHAAQARLEDRGEDLRLLYVALTRARHQAVVWWAGAKDSAQSALGRLLFARHEDGEIDAYGQTTPSDAVTRARLAALAAQAPAGAITVEDARPGPPTTWGRPLELSGELAVAAFTRRLDRQWRRTSYSDITAGAHDATVASEPEQRGVRDEPTGGDVVAEAAPAALGDDPEAAPAALGDGAEPELPLAAMPTGAAVGTVIHGVLQATDFAAADLATELRARVEAAVQGGISLGEPDRVLAGLIGVIGTPLDGFALRDVAAADRLDELAFELPLAGGDEPTGAVELGTLASVLREHLSPGDPLAGYATRLADPALRSGVRGYLTGFLDLVIRRPGPRFVIVDYKTNWLAGPDDELRAWHYRPRALQAEMERRHYGLQALFYTVALHRYLRWRLQNYDPARHLGGVHYAFLRGMTGEPGAGVFSWQPPPRAVEGLSDVLDGVLPA